MLQVDSVLSQISGKVLTLTLNRAEKLNALNAEMLLTLSRELDRASTSPEIRAVFLTGAGRGFCAGQDLSVRRRHAGDTAPDLGASLNDYYNPLILKLRALEKPVVCAVNGVAAGAGASLAFACDIVLAAKSARFIQAFSNIGLVPDAGGSWTLTHLLGEVRAKALVFTAEPLSAQQAADWGLIWKAVDDTSLLAEAESLVSRLAKGPTLAIGMSKQLIQAAATQGLSEQLDRERDFQRRAGYSEDYSEGIKAFTEKRKPIFSGT